MRVPYIASAGVAAVCAYTWLVAAGEWKRGNRFGSVALAVLTLGVFALGVYEAFRK